MFKDRSISAQATMLEALKHMDKIDKKLLLINDNNYFVGLISVGDIQRAIIKKIPFDTPIIKIKREANLVANENQTIDEVKEMMVNYRMEFCPIINSSNEIINILYWEDFFLHSEKHKGQFSLPIVIMAGGFGTRLKPLTNVIPKPLVPYGEKTIIETIIDRFIRNGSNDFYISVNYKSDFIKFYLKNIENVRISYIDETTPSGTAGSLSKLKNLINGTFFVTNCDILIDEDYSDILNFHKKNNNKITIVSAIKNMPLDYGTIETGENGKLLKIVEKPDLTFQINTGMYILEPELFELIPDNTFFHITELIQKVLNNGNNVGVFPVSGKSWIDIGTWDEYYSNFLNK